jgi:pantoate--beta-alanine ligase
MVEEFNIPVMLHPVPTVRESDGLALSSRNRYLSESDRSVAPELYRSLRGVAQVLTREVGSVAGEGLEFNKRDERYSAALQSLMTEIHSQKERLTAFGFKIDYLEVVDFKSLQPVESIHERKQYIIAVAAWIGITRLIDNIIVE